MFAKIKTLICGPSAVENPWWWLGLASGLHRDLAASWLTTKFFFYINLLKQFLQDRLDGLDSLDLDRRWHQALASLNENIREKKAAHAVKHAWGQHVRTTVSERPAAFCCHLLRRQSRSSKEAACRGGYKQNCIVDETLNSHVIIPATRLAAWRKSLQDEEPFLRKCTGMKFEPFLPLSLHMRAFSMRSEHDIWAAFCSSSEKLEKFGPPTKTDV